MHSFIFAAVTALLATVSSAYPTKTTLHCRSAPNTGAKIIRTYPQGADISINCQTTGTKVKSSNVWILTQHGCYVADYYVKTGQSGIFKKKCGSKPSKPTKPTKPTKPGKSCGAPNINQATIDMIKSFEGFVPSPKPDPVGLPTVGYGHLCKKKGCKEVKYKFPLTKTTAAKLLQDDAKTFKNCITRLVKVPLNDNQYGALVSFAFNLGCGNVQTSTWLKRLNRGESPNKVISQELPKFNKAGRPLRVLKGLTRRRKAEVALFKKASKVKALPAKKC